MHRNYILQLYFCFGQLFHNLQIVLIYCFVTYKKLIQWDFKLKEAEYIPSLIDEYIRFFNEERLSYSLNYLTPKQFKEIFIPSK